MSLQGAALVTGATGFIGRNLVTRLVEAGVDVVCLLREKSLVPDFPPSAAGAFRSARILRVSGGLDEVWRALPRVDWIFHLAAAGVKPSERDPALLNAANVDYPRQMVEFAAKVGARFVMAGSSAEYADPTGAAALDEASPPQRERIYGASKAEGTMAALATARARAVPALCCRLFNIYGPGEPEHRLFAAAVSGFIARRRIPLSSGTQIRDFVSVSDACSGMLAAAAWLADQTGTNGNGVMNLCSGQGRSVLEFARDVGLAVGGDPALIGIGDLPLRADDVPALVGDSGLLRSRTGWRPLPHAVALAREIEVMTKGRRP